MGRPSSCKMRVAYVHARVFSSSCQHALSSPSNRTTVPTTPQARDCCQFQHPQRKTQRRHPTARGESCAWRGSARAGHHAPRAERCQSRATTFASGPRQHDCHNPGAFHRAATRTQARKRSAATTDSPSLASSTCSWGSKKRLISENHKKRILFLREITLVWERMGRPPHRGRAAPL